MAHLTIDTGVPVASTNGIRTNAAAFWTGLKNAFWANLDAQARLDKVRRLQAMSDAQLAQMGLTRDRIAYHVFRDRFWL